MAAIAMRPPAGRRPLVTLLVLAVAAGLTAVVYALASPAADRGHVPPVVTAAGLVERSGVRLVHVAVTGAGGLVDLRYQVVDADKAQLVHDTPPLLIEESTGGVVMRPWMGHMHMNASPKQGVTYFVLFENTGDLIRTGGTVTVQLGDARVAHVRVQ
jgi:hypothetical protein